MIVKICGLTRAEDIAVAVEAGADAIGIVGEPASPRFVPPDAPVLAELAHYSEVLKVRVYGRYQPPVPPGFDAIQAVDADQHELPHIDSHLVVRETPPPDWTPRHCTRIVVDAFDPHAWGGSGKPADEQVFAAVRRLTDKPVILAGGLNPDNVAEAIQRLRPDGVDVSSGVETAPGIKDHGAIRAFIQAVRALSANG